MKRKKETIELRVYEIPHGQYVLPLYGDTWVRVYGHDQPGLHFHNLMEVGICRYGRGELRTLERTYEYEAGCLSIFPANYPHTTYSYGEEPNFWEYLFFDPKSIVKNLYEQSPVYANEVVNTLNSSAIILPAEDCLQLTALVDCIINESREKKHFHHAVISHYIKIFLFETMRLHDDMPYYTGGPSKTANADQITAAIDYIMDNLESQIIISDLADVCNMSETHFRRIFEDYVDMSPMNYVNLCRIQKACNMMKQSTDSMNVIAEKCGFTNVSTFSRNFKKFLGITPYQWKIAPDNYEGKLNKYHISPREGW